MAKDNLVEKATPRPWRADKHRVIAADNYDVAATDYGARTRAECEANAELIVRSVNQSAGVDALVTALQAAISAAEYVVKVCESDLEAGRDPSPMRKSAPSAALAECYGAMAFVGQARAALAQVEELRKGEG